MERVRVVGESSSLHHHFRQRSHGRNVFFLSPTFMRETEGKLHSNKLPENDLNERNILELKVNLLISPSQTR